MVIFIKYEFSPKNTGSIATTGYYLVNTKDHAINEFHLLNIDKNRGFQERRGLKYRTIYYELFVTYKKNMALQNYFLDKAKVKATVEVIDKDEKSILFNAAYFWIAHEQTDRKIDKKQGCKKIFLNLKNRTTSSSGKTRTTCF